jgi:hypothetical protein
MKKVIIALIMLYAQSRAVEFPLVETYLDSRSPLYSACTSQMHNAECCTIEVYLASVHDRYTQLANATRLIDADTSKNQQEKELAALNKFTAIIQETKNEHTLRVIAIDATLQHLGVTREDLYPSVQRMTYDLLKDVPLAIRTFMCAR